MMFTLATISAVSCLLAAILIVVGMRTEPPSRGRHAGRVLMATGFGLLGSRLAWLLLTEDLVRLNVFSMIGITFIGVGTCAVFTDIIDRAAGRATS